MIAQSVGLTIHGLFEAGGLLLGRERIEAFSTAKRVAVLFAHADRRRLDRLLDRLEPAGRRRRTHRPGRTARCDRDCTVDHVVDVLVPLHGRQDAPRHAEAERERARARAVGLQRQALDAQLRSLQAQIEPHFLFNTLANVVSLIDTAPANARRMLERLIELLRASLSASRATAPRWRRKRAVAAYLDILRIRMGERLSYTHRRAGRAMVRSMPPLPLQPLVENSIKHGLEPKLAGGTVQLSARCRATRLQITSTTTGSASAQGRRRCGPCQSARTDRVAVRRARAARHRSAGARHALSGTTLPLPEFLGSP